MYSFAVFILELFIYIVFKEVRRMLLRYHFTRKLLQKMHLISFSNQQQQSQTIVSSTAATSIVVNSVTHTAPIQATQTSVATPPVASVAPVVVPLNVTPANQVSTLGFPTSTRLISPIFEFDHTAYLRKP